MTETRSSIRSWRDTTGSTQQGSRLIWKGGLEFEQLIQIKLSSVELVLKKLGLTFLRTLPKKLS